MRVVALVFSVLAITSLGSCTGFTDTSIQGVAPQQAMDISAAIGTQKHAHHIYSCTRWPDGKIIVETDVGNYSAQRVANGWQFAERIITGGR
jgi:hypothetical protein